MSKVYVISDPHFGHHNIAIKRGFKDAAEQDAHIIKMWNSVVKKKDVVWILGDITMEKATNYDILDKLNGIKKVVLGNHDMPQHVPKLLEHVRTVCGMFKYKGVILSHAPIHESEIDRFRYNIHGHVHEKTLDDDRYINVCCDVVNYTPQPLDDLFTSPETMVCKYAAAIVPQIHKYLTGWNISSADLQKKCIADVDQAYKVLNSGLYVYSIATEQHSEYCELWQQRTENWQVAKIAGKYIKIYPHEDGAYTMSYIKPKYKRVMDFE